MWKEADETALARQPGIADQEALQPARTVARREPDTRDARHQARSACSPSWGRAAGPDRRQALNRAAAADWGSVCQAGRAARVVILCVYPQTEFITQDALHEMGIHALVPFERRWPRASRHARRRVCVDRPLFARYVFAEARALGAGLRQVRGVLTGCGGAVYALRAAELDWLCAMGAEPVTQAEAVPGAALHEGMRARIGEGPLSGLEGVIAAIRGQRARVRLKMFGAAHGVSVPLCVLEAA